ncbi:hypothetical protein N783_16495 [Pontibacillus marinus BH030004 = DSM 16465]|uniref:Glyoxalase n=2 Tax=Pontibacillus TaxID=289201 RepID=A0A0A5G0M7_9BACI|nr:hypothetical protein N783_16495 [Pontibacillus marinus BH030004 = DSM 16465]
MREEAIIGEEPTPTIMERMLKAVEMQDKHTIVTTYHLLMTRGVKVNRSHTHFTFTIQDPDGNKMILQEKI